MFRMDIDDEMDFIHDGDQRRTIYNGRPLKGVDVVVNFGFGKVEQFTNVYDIYNSEYYFTVVSKITHDEDIQTDYIQMTFSMESVIDWKIKEV